MNEGRGGCGAGVFLEFGIKLRCQRIGYDTLMVHICSVHMMNVASLLLNDILPRAPRTRPALSLSRASRRRRKASFALLCVISVN